ncbi:MAG: hypothetical protein V4813_07535 [Gemmatimonadota bacterium]
MKRKSPRDIPAFARAAMKPKDGAKDAPHAESHHAPAPRAAAPPAQPARIKPQGTSAKSGQRGK